MQLVQGYFGVLAKDLVTTGKRYALRAVIWQWANGLFGNGQAHARLFLLVGSARRASRKISVSCYLEFR
jgi:hypothetical protein